MERDGVHCYIFHILTVKDTPDKVRRQADWGKSVYNLCSRVCLEFLPVVNRVTLPYKYKDVELVLASPTAATPFLSLFGVYYM